MTDSLPRGTSLPGQYVVEGVLGAGRVRTVYAARGPDGSRAAAHVLHESLAEDLGEWFSRYTERVAGLDHPGLVKVIARGTVDGKHPVLVTELLEGQTVRNTLAGPPVATTEVARILVSLGAVLDHLHALTPPMVHRALMPENVFLAEPDRRVKLLEVGAADRPRFAAARPAYNAPESLAGITELSPRADVFVLGSLAYEMLTGSPAFPGDANAALHAMRADTRPTVSTRRRAVGPAVDAVLKRAWSLSPDGRQPSAGVLARELSEALAATTDSVPAREGDPGMAPSVAVPHTDEEPTSRLIALDAMGKLVSRKTTQPVITPLAPRHAPRENKPTLPPGVVTRAPGSRARDPQADAVVVDEATDRDIPTSARSQAMAVTADPVTPRIADSVRPAPPVPNTSTSGKPPPQAPAPPVSTAAAPTATTPPAPAPTSSVAAAAPVTLAVPRAPAEPQPVPPAQPVSTADTRRITPPVAPRTAPVAQPAQPAQPAPSPKEPVPEVLSDLKDDPTETFTIPTAAPPARTRSSNLLAAAVLANGIALAGIAHAIAWAVHDRAAPVVIQAPAAVCAPCTACPPSPPAPPTVPAPAPVPVAAPVPLPAVPPARPQAVQPWVRPVVTAVTPAVARTVASPGSRPVGAAMAPRPGAPASVPRPPGTVTGPRPLPPRPAIIRAVP